MKNEPYNIEDRLVSFAAMIFYFCKDLPNDLTGLNYGKQLLRSGGSSALNFGEYQGAFTERERINKLTISLKALKESRMNLSIMLNVKYGSQDRVIDLPDEVEQLIKIITTIIRNKK